MNDKLQSEQLIDQYNQTKYKLMGHGVVTTNILIESMEEIGKSLERDVYGNGAIITNFQNKIAKDLGMEDAVFYPSGTMAQQIALRMWCDKKGVKTVAYHGTCHLEIHEEDGLKQLHGIKTILLGEEDRLFTLEDLKAVKETIAAVVIELPQREIGGQLPSFEELTKITEYCHDSNIAVHLDGARLFECLPYYQKTADEICRLFDSVYISFYKGIGGITGAMLASNKEFCKESKVWKRRYGGDLYALYPYIIPADYCYDLRKNKFDVYYEGALKIADLFNQCDHIQTLPLVPVSNMFHVHFNIGKEKVEEVFCAVYKDSNVGIRASVFGDDKHCYFEFNIGDGYLNIPTQNISKTFNKLKELLGDIEQ